VGKGETMGNGCEFIRTLEGNDTFSIRIRWNLPL
jgi:hypothetical protein